MTYTNQEKEAAITFVCNFYGVTRDECITAYWDEVEAYLRLLDKGVV